MPVKISSPELGSYDHLMGIAAQKIPEVIPGIEELTAILAAWRVTESFARAIQGNHTRRDVHKLADAEERTDRILEGSGFTAWLDSGLSPQGRAYPGEGIEVSGNRDIVEKYRYSLRIPTICTPEGLHVVRTGDLPPHSWYASYESEGRGGLFDPDADDGRMGGPHALLAVATFAAYDLAVAGLFADRIRRAAQR